MKKTIISSLILSGALMLGMSSCSSNYSTPSMKSDVDSVSYAIGVMTGTQHKMSVEQTPGEPLNVDNIITGFISALKGDTSDLQISPDAAMQVIQGYFTKIQQQEADEAKTKGAEYLAAKEKEEGVVKTESGLLYKVVTEGKGAKPTATSRVKVNYKGTLVDGKEFDSSYARNEPAEFGVDQVIPGWTEGLQLMSVGSKYIFYIPAELGYGERRAGMIAPNSVLTFEVELLDIIKEDKK